jgi:hypothetical protein
MIPTNPVIDQLALLLAGDVTTLAPVTLGNKVALVKNSFVPGPNLGLADFVISDFAGSNPILSIAGPQFKAIDPLTGERYVEMRIPALGWRWTVQAVTALPQTVYGAVMMNNASAIVFGSVLFPRPILLDTVGQVVEIDTITFRFLAGAIT